MNLQQVPWYSGHFEKVARLEVHASKCAKAVITSLETPKHYKSEMRSNYRFSEAQISSCLLHLKSSTKIVVLTVMTSLAKGANRLQFQIYFFIRNGHCKQVTPQKLPHQHFRLSTSGVRDGVRATEKEQEGLTSKNLDTPFPLQILE